MSSSTSVLNHPLPVPWLTTLGRPVQRHRLTSGCHLVAEILTTPQLSALCRRILGPLGIPLRSGGWKDMRTTCEI